MTRAYSLLHVKSIDPVRRVIRGIATTPEPDRTGDIVDPLGAKFRNPIPLLLHHDPRTPVGVARFEKATADGIAFEAELPIIDEPGAVKDEVDRAWQSIKAGLILGVSIGFRAIGEAIEVLKSGGVKFLSIEILELSLVTIPANQQATLAVVKSLDLQAASGRHTPGVTGTSTVVRLPKAAPLMTIQESIASFENSRAAKAARMTALMTTEPGVTLDAAQTEEYDGLDRDVKSIDAHLVRLNALDSTITKTAISGVTTTQQGANIRAGLPVITVTQNVGKGIGMARYAMAIGHAKGNIMLAEQIAKQRWPDAPELGLMFKAAVAAGTTTDATWGGPLVPAAQALTGEFLDLLRPATILGKINLRKVPFDIKVPALTAGGTYGWVGEGKVKPVSSLALATVSIGHAKIAGIIVLTQELVRSSSPAAEETVRNDMVRGVSAFMDAQLLDPAVAAVPGVNPASITNGTAALTSAGTSADNARADIKALIATFVVANQSTQDAVLIMSEANAFALGVALNPLGQALFPGLGAGGGTIMGIPVVTSQAAGSMIILVDQRGVLYADDGQVTIDVSQEASLQMDSAPTDPVVGATVMISLFQQNMIALRAERYCAWARARLSAVKYTTGAAYA